MKLLKTIQTLPLKWKILLGVQGVVTIGMMIQRQSMIKDNKKKDTSTIQDKL